LFACLLNFLIYLLLYLSVVYTVPPNDTPLACYNVDVHQPILIIFGRNVTETANSHAVIYFSSSRSNASALPGKTQEHENLIFTQMFYYCFSRVNQSLLDLFNVVDLQLIFTLQCTPYKSYCLLQCSFLCVMVPGSTV